MRDENSTRFYVERHMWPELTSANQANMIYLAGLDKVGKGRVHATYEMIGTARGRSARTVGHQLTELLRTPRFLLREGWTFIIAGAAQHDEYRCGHGACIAAALGAQVEARRLSAIDELAALRRKRDAERKKAARAARKTAEGF